MGPFPRVRSWSSARRVRSSPGSDPLSAHSFPPGPGWAGRQSDAVLSQASAATCCFWRPQRAAAGELVFRNSGNVSVRASHTGSGSRKATVCARDCQALKASPPGGTRCPRSPAPAPVPRVPGAVAGYRTTTPRRLRDQGRTTGGGPLSEQPANPGGTWRTALPEVPGSGPRAWRELPYWSRALLLAKMAAEHPEPPKGELQLPPPPPPGHYGAWAAQELQAKLAEIGAPIQGKENWRSRSSREGLRGSGAWLPRRSGGGGGPRGPDLGGRA